MIELKLCTMLIMQIRDSLTKRAKEFNILVDDVAITHLSFGTEVCAPFVPAASDFHVVDL